jgi:phosphatidylinositol glycan class B
MEINSRFRIDDSRLRWLLLFSLLVQIIFSITQVGFLHPDQHFQLIEFSSWQLGEPSGATSVWELKSHIRPTAQVYLFSGFIIACRFFHIYDAFVQLAILRLLFGLLGFVVFNAIGIYYFKSNKKLLYLVLLLINLSWSLPYIRTLFSSEMASSIVFFGAILLYELKKEKFLYVLLTGFLFSLAFYFRFQIAFGIVGFGIWFLFIDRKYVNLLPIAIGFAVGVAINIFLDYHFYHQLVFTPFDYYRVNITEGKAAEFGTSSFLWYILLLALVIGTPPLSIFLFYYSLKGAGQQYRQPLVFAVAFFIIGHCLVAHKEERFIFPIVNVLPVIAGWGLESFITYYQRARTGIRNFLKGILYFSVALNTLVLILFLILNPYYQAIEFTRKLTNTFKDSKPIIYCFSRTPFETESGLPLTFYRKNAPNINLIKFHDADSARYLKNAWMVTTFNDAKDKLSLFDSLGFKPQLYSSAILWNTNEYLQSKKIGTINEIWILYKKE